MNILIFYKKRSKTIYHYITSFLILSGNSLLIDGNNVLFIPKFIILNPKKAKINLKIFEV